MTAPSAMAHRALASPLAAEVFHFPYSYAISIHLPCALVCGKGRRASFKVADDDLFLLDLLIGCEKMRYFLQHMLIRILDILHVGIARVAGGDRDNFFIRLAAVRHVHDADWASRGEDAGHERVRGEQDNVKRVAVVPERLRHEAVVKGIVLRAVHDSVELDDARLLINLILIVRALRDLNDDVHLFLRARVNVVQQIHIRSLYYSSFALSRSSSASATVSSLAGSAVSSSSAGSTVTCGASSVITSVLSVGIAPTSSAGVAVAVSLSDFVTSVPPAETMSMFHQVSFAASRTFCPPRPMASDCSSSQTVTVARWSASSSTTASGVAGESASLINSLASSFHSMMSMRSPPSSLITVETRTPRWPTREPTGSTCGSSEASAILVRLPGSLASAFTSIEPAASSGASISKSFTTNFGCARESRR